MNTPWGCADHVAAIAPGIWHVTTPSHGGYRVSLPQLAAIPVAWRAASVNGQGMRGWFEEDCDWCMVTLTWPELFPPAAQKAAQATFDHWIAPKLAAKRSA